MYENLIKRLREYPDREENANGYVEIDWQDFLDAADTIESLTGQLAALQAYRALGPVEELSALVKAHIDQPPAKEGDPKPSCFYEYGDSLWCLGLSHECDDEPLDRCKQCWYCESGDYADDRAEEETALGGGGDG